MQPTQERRRLGAERYKYLVLRLYARMLKWSSIFVLVVSVVSGMVIILFALPPAPARFSNGFLMMGAGTAYFVVARGMAEILYLLLDVARNTHARREQPTAGAPSNST